MVESTSLPDMPPAGQGPQSEALLGSQQRSCVLSRIVRDYQGFLDDCIRLEQAPYFYVALWIAGVAGMIDRIELRTLFGGDYLISNWLGVWAAALLLAVVAGPMAYYVLGGFFHIRVLMCGGYRRFKVSRLIWLYSSWPIFLWTILVTVLDTVVYGDVYFTGQTNDALDTVTGVVFMLCLGYSI